MRHGSLYGKQGCHKDVRDALCCLRMTPRYTSVTTRRAAERPQDMPGQHRDASGRLKDTPDGFTDLADTHGWGLQIFIFLADVSLSVINITSHVSSWEVLTTGYLDAWMPMGIKRGKVQPH